MLIDMMSSNSGKSFFNFGRGRPWWRNLLFGLAVGMVAVGLTVLYNEVVADGATAPGRSVSTP